MMPKSGQENNCAALVPATEMTEIPGNPTLKGIVRRCSVRHATVIALIVAAELGIAGFAVGVATAGPGMNTAISIAGTTGTWAPALIQSTTAAPTATTSIATTTTPPVTTTTTPVPTTTPSPATTTATMPVTTTTTTPVTTATTPEVEPSSVSEPQPPTGP
ncbi:hypothetical protein GCM10009764_75380 [Nocardia ninae]|uniref:Uncharacterized protein n=1 Tax=Nocardia ninae NBRC 108245 TaxID=1210091 RepID=A0A511MGM5_9NOCA|nr:hypothetical protein NN4_43310 [Nocardia ninae NBRC 108245]